MFRFVRLLLSGHQAIAIENAALRMQIAAFQRKRKRPLLTTLDRLFRISLRSVWSDWRVHYFMSSQTPSFVGSANGSANSRLGSLSRSFGGVVVPVPPQNSAD